MTHVVIIGGGPGGYEAALVAAQLGGRATLIERSGLGGASVLTDCVPSKTLIATAELMSDIRGSGELGLRFGPAGDHASTAAVRVDLAAVNERVLGLAQRQSTDIADRLRREGVQIIAGTGRLAGPQRVIASTSSGEQSLDADVVLLATGAHPRVLPDAVPDGERILTWTQLYGLDELPKRLIVVGSGVTGAEFASAYHALGSEVVLVSSRDRVLPGEDADAARVLEDVFDRNGLTVMSRSRAGSVRRVDDHVVVTLTDGREVLGSHCLLAVGSIANTEELGLESAGVQIDERGFVVVDKVSRTSARGVYAAGDCTGVLMLLASVAAMQGRIAMWHSLGDAVGPLDRASVSANVFTAPEIATVGVSQQQVDAGEFGAVSVKLTLKGNPRAKMQGIRDGFVKIFCLPVTGIIVGGVVVAPRASELIFPLAIAVAQRITVDQLAQDFTVYPSISGSLSEAARRLHGHDQLQLKRSSPMIRPTNLRFGSDWRPSSPEVLARSFDDQLDEAVRLLSGRSWTCLTGAGMSTDSGIPDYRGPESPTATPMMYGEFVGSEANRKRYWARSFLGWQRMRAAHPNAGHLALVELGSYGLNGVITQNVDGLHHEAGSDPVIDLHGRISRVICLDCGRVSSRADYQERLLALNPDVRAEVDLAHAELRPDGDAVVEDWSDFKIAPCLNCGGVLKPDVIFFGESVPRARVDDCYRLVDASDALLVAGSSLAVMSGLRFVRHDAKRAKPVIIINRGATRGDDLATSKIDAGTTQTLVALRDRLVIISDRYSSH